MVSRFAGSAARTWTPVEWRIEGRPWEWRELVLQLPAGFSGKIILEFEYRWPTDENGAMRALPFRRIQLDSGGGGNLVSMLREASAPPESKTMGSPKTQSRANNSLNRRRP